MMLARRIDLTRPATWEFSGFSQNGEDGILDVLRHQLTRSNRYFIEIGAADGIENNIGALASREFAQAFLQIVFGVIQSEFGAMRLGEFDFLIRGRAGDDRGRRKARETR